jgi:hypothetical protein
MICPQNALDVFFLLFPVSPPPHTHTHTRTQGGIYARGGEREKEERER